MRHELRIEGFAFRLRPVALDDAQFIVDVRTHEQRSRYLHHTSRDVEEQTKWLKCYLEREGEYYFVIERRLPIRKEGLVVINNFSDSPRSAEWGRWVLVPGSLAAAESALLVYRTAFDVLALDEVFCRTIAENSAVVSFHDSSGLLRRAVMEDYFDLGGPRYAAIEHVLTRERWPVVSETLTTHALRVARRVITSDHIN